MKWYEPRTHTDPIQGYFLAAAVVSNLMVTAPIILCLSCVLMQSCYGLHKLLRFRNVIQKLRMQIVWIRNEYLHIYCLLYLFAGWVRACIASRLCKVLFIQSVGKRACFGDASVDKPSVESSHSVAWLFTGWFCKFWLRDDSNNVKKCNLVPINYVQLLTFEPIQLNVWL